MEKNMSEVPFSAAGTQAKHQSELGGFWDNS
jgi:hypothetical protein